MSQKEFGIGIVGCGNISDTHALAVKETRRGKLVSAHSRTVTRLQKFCSTHDITGSHSYDEFLNNDNLDVVSICTPSGTHLDYGIKAAEAGKHLIVEKPIEVTTKRGKDLIRCCKKNGVKLAVIYQNRFDDEVLKMKQALDQGEIGDPILASASVRWYRDHEYYSDSNWRGTLDLDGGGVVINQSIHTIDLLQWLVGDIESVSAFKGAFTHEDIEAEDTAVATLKYKRGTIGVFEGSTSITPSQERRIEVNGTKGTLLLDGRNLVKNIGDRREALGKKNADSIGASSPLDGMEMENHCKQFDQILDSFSNEKSAVVAGREALKSLAVVEAIYKSSDIEKLVSVEEFLA